MTDEQSLKIVSLQVENVKRISAAYIEPDGRPVVVIGGANGQGKTSLLDAIWMVLGGKNAVCPKPVKDGEERGEITLDLGPYIVRRTFTAEGRTTLEVRNPDGAKYSSPQALLDRFVGDLSFDPLAFSRLDGKKQVEALRSLTGLDFDALDDERQRLYDERTQVNREAKTLEAKLRGMPVHDDAPAEEVSVAGLVGELEAANRQAEDYADAQAAVGDLARGVELARDVAESTRQRIASVEEELARLRDQLSERAAAVVSHEHSHATAEADLAERLATNPIPDLAAIRQRIAGAEACNAKVRENAAKAEASATLETRKAEAAALTDKIDGVDADKRRQIEEAELPVPGIAFGADGVTLDGIPFEQCCSAEQIKASVAIGVAMNPRLKVMLIRDGALLDENSRELVRQQAEASGTQFWMEVVGNSADVSVLIEDGAIVGHAAEAAE